MRRWAWWGVALLALACLQVEKKDRFSDKDASGEVKAEVVGPDGAQPDLVLPDGAQPDLVLPDGVEPDLVLPDGAQPDLVLPDGAQPDLVQPEGVLPDLITPDPGGPDTPADLTPPDTGPTCSGFEIRSYQVHAGKHYLVFGEAATFDVDVFVASGATVPDASVTMSPPAMAAYYTDVPGQGGTFALTQADISFATTEVVFTLTVSDGVCTDRAEARVKVLGNVWVAEANADVVQVFRSDGAFLGLGIPSTYLEDPWEVVQLGPDRVAVGMQNKGGVEVYDRQGNRQTPFQAEDAQGNGLYSVYGARSILLHQPDGHVWVGGVRGKVLDYKPDGTYAKTIWWNDYQTGELEARELMQLPDGSVLTTDDNSFDWDFYLYDDQGKYVSSNWGDNSNELEMRVNRFALTPEGKVIVAGYKGYPANKGYLARLKSNGIMEAHSEPIAAFYPNYGLTPFGEGYLCAGEVSGQNETPLALFDRDLTLVTGNWEGDKVGRYRGMIVMGGN